MWYNIRNLGFIFRQTKPTMNFTDAQLKTLSDYFDGQSELPVVIQEMHTALRSFLSAPIPSQDAPVDVAPVVDAPTVTN